MVFNNSFTCPDGHTFTANAKLHARCPECGKTARRFGKTNVAVSDKSEIPSPTAEPKQSGVKLIRQGKPRLPVMPKRTTPPKDEHGKFVSASAVASKAKKSVRPMAMAKSGAPVLVKRHTVTARKVTPKVRKTPPKTAIARHIAGGKESYADSMIQRARLRF